MKYFLVSLGVNLVALACVIAAGYLAANDKDGWGWFLLTGLLCAGTASMQTAKA